MVQSIYTTRDTSNFQVSLKNDSGPYLFHFIQENDPDV